jgi:hypothetical protein
MSWEKLRPKDLFDWLLIAALAFVLFGDKLNIGGITGPQEICAVSVGESANAPKWSKEQLAAVNSPESVAYMAGKGYPYFVGIDPDSDASRIPAIKQALEDAKDVDEPCLVIYARSGDSLGKLLYKGNIATEADVLPILKKYGGG